MKWYEIDFNWYGIWALEKLGLAKKIYVAKISEKAERRGIAAGEHRWRWLPRRRSLDHTGFGGVVGGMCLALRSVV